MDLAGLVSTGREQIIDRWTEKVRGALHPQAMPPLELVDHLPQFLEEVADALRRFSSPEESLVAASHGVQRLSLGFSLDGVVREYGALRDAILEVARAEAIPIDAHEHQVLFDCVITGIAAAVSEYVRARDAEQTRQTNEHFAFIAHELRNPLSSSLMAFKLLRKRGAMADDRATTVLERGLDLLRELIESTLQTAQVGAGITLHRAPLSLERLLADAEGAASTLAEEKGIRLWRAMDRERTLLVDPRLVRSALTNLVLTGVKFSPEGGTVEIRARSIEGRVAIEVEDSCGGLPPGTVEKAFTPFAQMGSDRSGFGLGLAIAKQASDAHGGAIRIQNLPGKGCIFVLELPVSTSEAGERPGGDGAPTGA